ncbi:Crp/Fnr family transcriptional regulator [Shewanella sp. D64]|uniref:Crp/Fnr family transcriptional regulator n=1 Tax=unclassified Shewanella TaxID=196818 RepID=UPI0022BA27FC|nr:MULTISPECIES: Crp/Fnr family transcriptional regulator [unclassified Shewanella]MEC4728913.1 Crp/Fnr family transcriptional regulator [Shewanella sp. D64]MEC4740799.1 Crp/Fnr family transcriptional regulator [Shewanella sp. E94]WBJ96013.1 Crp/Fnr family transcriptional regulator [Shewanella sp. MTB7]
MVQAISLNTEMKEGSTIFFPEVVKTNIAKFLISHGTHQTIKKGSNISKNILLNNFIYVGSGLLFYIKRTNDYSRPKFINVILPNRLTDYHLLLKDNCTCCKNIKAARDSEIIIINKSIINNLAETDTALFTEFMFDSNYFMERQTALAIFLLTSSPEDKLTKFLFDLLVVLKVDFSTPWLEVSLKLTREEIADILHISVIKLDIMFGHLKKRGVLKREDNKLYVKSSFFYELSPCPLGREDAKGCQSNNMLKFKPNNMIAANNI